MEPEADLAGAKRALLVFRLLFYALALGLLVWVAMVRGQGEDAAKPQPFRPPGPMLVVDATTRTGLPLQIVLDRHGFLRKWTADIDGHCRDGRRRTVRWAAGSAATAVQRGRRTLAWEVSTDPHARGAPVRLDYRLAAETTRTRSRGTVRFATLSKRVARAADCAGADDFDVAIPPRDR